MNPIEKLFRKIRADERAILNKLIKKLEHRETSSLQIMKLSGYDCYRVRKGIFRIIFHYDKNILVIDAVRLRNEKTYREY